jgi:hypothetical protein
MDSSRLNRRVAQGLEMHKMLAHAYEMRRSEKLAASNKSFYDNIRLAEYQHPDDFMPGLETFSGGIKGEDSSGPAVILSGILPHPELLGLLDEQGVRVADDDLLNCGRRMPLLLW